MAEILLPDCQFPRLSDGATCRDIQPKALCQACTAHVQVAALRIRLESAEAALKRIADYTEKAGRDDGGMLWAVWEMARAALAVVGQEQQHLVCSACGRASDTEPRGGLCGMPRPPLGICCGRFRAAIGAAGEKERGRDG